jgi:hypothetical protein
MVAGSKLVACALAESRERNHSIHSPLKTSTAGPVM